jgi:acyl transferase domain-containing protein
VGTDRSVAAVPVQAPRLPWLSNVTGTWISAEEATDPAYWGRHLRAPVRFADGVGELLARPGVLLEVGPGETLGRLARRELRRRSMAGQAPLILSTLPPGPGSEPAAGETSEPLDEEAHLLRTAGRLWLAGVRLDWRALQAGRSRRRVHLPTYPFERRRYWLEPKPMKESAEPSPAERPTSGREMDPAGWFYLPSWKRSLPPSPAAAGGELDGDVLIFLDDEGLGEGIASRLRAAGSNVATVLPGESFADLGGGAYTLRAGEPADYDALLESLPSRGQGVSAVLHLWSFGAPRPSVSGPALDGPAVDRAFYSPLFLAQALERRRVDERRLDLWLVSSSLHDVSGGDLVVPERALLLGPGKVIPLELPGVLCHSLDLEAGGPDGPGRGRLDRAVERLWSEVTARSPETVIAWRGRQRWLQSFEPVRLEAGGAAAPRLRPGGVYVITGGLGGVGHAIARWLARDAGAKLVLVGRTALPPRGEWDGLLARGGGDPLSQKVRRLRDLEEAGAEVLTVQADVTDPVGMAQVRAVAIEHWGAVHGVIHAAGVPGGGVISRKDRAAADAVLSPKVQGTLALAAAFPPEELDLFVLCSSLNSVIGAYGQVDYCAANAFLDAFAGSRPTVAGRTVAIAWDAWSEAGMAVETAGSPGLRRLAGLPAGAEVDHPLLDRRVPAGPGEHAFLTRLDATRHWVLDEHRIQGTPVLPGTAYLELARAAFEQSTGSAAAEIRQAAFVVPLPVPDGESRDVYTVLRRQGDGWSFRIASREDADGAPRWQEHAIGEIAPLAAAEEERPTLPELLAELPLVNALPPAGANAGGEVMRFGPRWGNLRRIAAAGDRFLALLRFPAEFSSDLPALGLHPALLDRATSFAQALVPAVDRVYMPFAYSGMRIERPLPGELYSFVRTKPGSGGEELHFEVTLFAPAGELLVRIDDFAFRRVDPRLADPSRLRQAEEVVPVTAPMAPMAPIAQAAAREGLTSADGVEAFRRILESADLPQVLVSVRDLPARVAEAAALTGQRILAELDRAGSAAPAGPRHERPELATAYVAPSTETERWLSEIWGDLLGIEAVGIHDDFFELGGDSVLSLRIVARARDRGLVLTPGRLFERPTIAGLAAELDTAAPVQPVAMQPTVAATAPVPAEATPPTSEGEGSAGLYDPASFPDADVSQRDLEALFAQLGGLV